MKEGEGDRFQRETKYHPDRMSGGMIDWSGMPEPYKEYPGARRIGLPRPDPSVSMDLHEALSKRRSVRSFSGKPLGTEQLSYLLWASTGIQRRERGFEFRTAPSAGALYPIETYIVANRVEGIGPGVYHYPVRIHCLETLKEGRFGREIAAAALGQEICDEAAVVFVWTAVFQRSKWKYRQRAYRYVYLDAGHIAQNLALSAVSIGLGSCQVAALFDDEVNRIIGVDGVEESAIYMSVVGQPD